VFTHTLPHIVVPSGQPEAQFPLEQARPGGQTLPQVPQLEGSEFSLVNEIAPTEVDAPAATAAPVYEAVAPLIASIVTS
jgi:hypothetical protein